MTKVNINSAHAKTPIGAGLFGDFAIKSDGLFPSRRSADVIYLHGPRPVASPTALAA